MVGVSFDDRIAFHLLPIFVLVNFKISLKIVRQTLEVACKNTWENNLHKTQINSPLNQ